jgi:hypothetical protein
MNKKLIFLNVVVIVCLLLSACGSSLNIQVPAPDGSSGDPTQGNFDNMLVYFLVGALVVITLIAVLGGGKRGP